MADDIRATRAKLLTMAAAAAAVGMTGLGLLIWALWLFGGRASADLHAAAVLLVLAGAFLGVGLLWREVVRRAARRLSVG